MSIALNTNNITTPTTGLDAADVAILNGSYVSATFSTRNSRYTLVKRAHGAVLIKDADIAARAGLSPVGIGTVTLGKDAWVETVPGGHVLKVADDGGRVVFQSSLIEGCYVLEN